MIFPNTTYSAAPDPLAGFSEKGPMKGTGKGERERKKKRGEEEEGSRGGQIAPRAQGMDRDGFCPLTGNGKLVLSGHVYHLCAISISEKDVVMVLWREEESQISGLTALLNEPVYAKSMLL